MGHNSHASSFCVVGQFLGYELKGHKIHRIHLRQDKNEYSLKLSSGARDDLLRAALEGNLQVGDWMEVSGLQEIDIKKGLRLKAHTLHRCDQPKKNPSNSSRKGSPTKVLVCQKSSCCKRGGKAVMQQVKKVVSDRQLDHQVTIKGTGCMGKCGKGPVIVIDKTQYRQVSAKSLSRLIDRHINP